MPDSNLLGITATGTIVIKGLKGIVILLGQIPTSVPAS